VEDRKKYGIWRRVRASLRRKESPKKKLVVLMGVENGESFESFKRKFIARLDELGLLKPDDD
jgi:hypothetical protein